MTQTEIDFLSLTGGLISAFGLGFGFGYWIKTIRAFFNQI